MLWELLLLALTGCCVTQAVGLEGHTADIEMLHKQKKIYELFFFIEQPKIVGSEMSETGYNYDIEANMDMYTDKMYVQDFLYRFKYGMLKRGALFTVYHEEHRHELVSLFRLFYTAKDFDTFYKTACFARIYVNEGMFVTALITAVMFRPDCEFVRVPPFYEIYPHLFFDHEVIQQANHIKMTMGRRKAASMDHVETFVVESNHTYTCDRCQTFENEYRLNYFIEDVDLNNYYYSYRTAYPFWLSMNDFRHGPEGIRGELFYSYHQQMVARYDLERLSNGLGVIEDFSFSKEFLPSFHSNLVHPNGVSFPKRDFMSMIPFHKYKHVTEIEIAETRILAAIDSGFLIDRDGKQIGIYSKEGLDMLGSVIEGNEDSCNERFYGAVDALYRDVFGFNYNSKRKNCYVPSALDSYGTSIRDPAFYPLYKRITSYFLRWKSNIPPYTVNELDFPGVKIENVHNDKIVTFFEKFDAKIDNAVTVDNWKEATSFNIMRRQYRLNHKPFTYRFDVKSDRSVKALVKISVGPYFDHYDNEFALFKDNWMNYFAVDKFIVDLKPGMNTIERPNTDTMFAMNEKPSGDKYYKKLLKAIEGGEPLAWCEEMYMLPIHLLYPKGTTEGTRYKLFVFLTPVESTMAMVNLPNFGKYLYDGKPMAFPLDRPVHPWYLRLPNMFLKDITIFHLKGEESFHGPGEFETYDDKYMDEKLLASKYGTKYGTRHHYDKHEKPLYETAARGPFNI